MYTYNTLYNIIIYIYRENEVVVCDYGGYEFSTLAGVMNFNFCIFSMRTMNAARPCEFVKSSANHKLSIIFFLLFRLWVKHCFGRRGRIEVVEDDMKRYEWRHGVFFFLIRKAV